MASKDKKSEAWNWVLGLIYIFLVAAIWIAASFVVQSVVDEGVSPFLVTYICNSLFIVYIPLVEVGRYLEDTYGSLLFWRSKKSSPLQELGESEQAILLGVSGSSTKEDELVLSTFVEEEEIGLPEIDAVGRLELGANGLQRILSDQAKFGEQSNEGLDAKGRWTRRRMAKVSLQICPFWFLAQLTFNLSLKYTTVTSNTILSSTSSLFTFLVSLAFLGEKFTCVKLASVLLCMAGTIIVSLGDSKKSNSSLKVIASNPVLGDIFALISAALYAVYITLIRKKLSDDDEKSGQASMALFLGYLGLFNMVLFFPFALILSFTKLEPFSMVTWQQASLIVGKGLLDNVLSDYLWAKAVLLTTTTVATAGLSIQVPLAALVDTLIGHAPPLLQYLGALAVMIGFAGINIPSDACSKSENASTELHQENVVSTNQASVTMS